MHGLGNDFVIVEAEQIPAAPWVDWVPHVCDRHVGVGADGVVLLRRSLQADVKMQIINVDGKEAEQCGNAVRCVAKYVYEEWEIRRETLQIETYVGVIQVQVEVERGEVIEARVDMGEPVIAMPLTQTVVVEDQSFSFVSVSMGNPHAVIEVDDVATFPVAKYGSKIEIDPLFPQQTNVEFSCFISMHEIAVRVWERGVGETLACGTGACAVVVAGVLRERCERKATVSLPGGKLAIHWCEEDNHVYMTGPAVKCFTGELLL